MARITKQMVEYQVELLNSKTNKVYELQRTSGGYGLYLAPRANGLRTGELGYDGGLTLSEAYCYVRGPVQATFAIAEDREVLKQC